MKRNLGVTALGIFLVVLSTAAPLSAQNIWTRHTSSGYLSFEFLKPDFEREGDYSFLTSAWYLSAKLPISSKFAIFAEFPFAHFGSNYMGRSISETTLGNPYLGVEIAPTGRLFFLELGIRASYAPDDDEDNGSAAMTGNYTDFIDRLEAFAAMAVPISAMANLFYEDPSGFAFRLRGGPCFWLARGERRDSETVLLYTAQLWYKYRRVSAVAGLSGRYWVSVEPHETDRNWNQIGLGLDFDFNRIQPGIGLRIPIDDWLSKTINLVFEIHVRYMFDWTRGN